MEEQSFQEKEGIIDSSISRLSESRPKFKPVLVKKLLAESDDDSDEAPINSDNSEEELDDFDGFQLLPDEGNNKDSSQISVPKADIKINIKDKSVSTTSAKTTSAKVVEDNGKSIKDKKCAQNPVLNTYLKDSLKISDYVSKKTEEEKLSQYNHKLKDTHAVKLEKSQDVVDQDNGIIQLQWQSNSSRQIDILAVPFKEQNELCLNAKSYSPEVKRICHSVSLNNNPTDVKEKVQHFESFNEAREEKEPQRYSSANVNKTYGETKDDKIQMHSKIQTEPIDNLKRSATKAIVNSSVMETPMKQLQGSTRPNPCHSHRNIFLTPQNKVGNDYLKNPIQTPATIFSHWSQHHMAQTPMHNQIPKSKESMPPTPSASITQAAQGTPR